ncbi:DHH family phosphoesterase [Candidatus Saccharibacteria bacterium]|nr:DHH family phosphoesterase [Candidatus Saccharibacteria bacterium]
MTDNADVLKLKELLADAVKIVVVQADNPDTDSLASALALEQILEDQGKDVSLYCGVDIPSYLEYISGADRVSNELPKQFDLSIIVDTASNALLEQLDKTGQKAWLAAKPSMVIDHHATAPTISFARLVITRPAVATGEVLYELAKQLDWPLNTQSKELLAMAILSDSLGLTSEATTARSIHIIAELVEGGVALAQLESARRESMRREAELVHYKGRLLQRVEFLDNGRIAAITIPQDEIDTYSPLYNPPMLVLDDMRLAKGTQIAVAFKVYKDGKVTAKIRCNFGIGIADKLAEHFGGGGHPYAAGFKLQDGRDFEALKQEFIATASRLLDGVRNKSL